MLSLSILKAGKVSYLGLSEWFFESFRRACKVHPIAAVQTKYCQLNIDIGHPSIVLCKDAESLAKPTRILDVACSQGNTDDPLPTAREAIGSVICHDSRPRTLSRNLQLIDKLEETTQRTGCRSGQLIMAWSTNQAEDIIAITLIKRIKYLQEKIGSLDVN